MSFANFISTIGNNSSVLPILFKDGIESSFKTGLAYKQGAKVSPKEGFYEARETAIEEFGTSAIWFATPIITGKIFDSAVKKKYGLSSKELLSTPRSLLNGKNYQTLEKNIKNLGNSQLKNDFNKLDNSQLKKLFLVRGWIGVATAIGLIAGLTKFKQNLTAKSIEKPVQKMNKEKKQDKNPSFKGSDSLIEPMLIDGGLSAIRIATARSKSERLEYVFKQATFILVAYFGGGAVEKILNGVTKVLKLPLNLDAKVLADKNFLNQAIDACKNQSKKENFLKFVKIDKNAPAIKTEEKVIKFIDKELSTGNFVNGKFRNQTLEAARQSGIISIKNNKREACKFVDTNAVIKTNEYLETLVNTATKKSNPKKFIKNLKLGKYGLVLANVAICSAILGIVLPKIQYLFREKMIGSVASPGIKATNGNETL